MANKVACKEALPSPMITLLLLLLLLLDKEDKYQLKHLVPVLRRARCMRVKTQSTVSQSFKHIFDTGNNSMI